MSQLGQNLKELLRQTNLSEKELSRRTGIPQQIINRITTGKNTNPKLATLTPIAKFFVVSISQLIGDETLPKESKISTDHLGFNKIPLLEWEHFDKNELDHLISTCNNFIISDIPFSSSLFALKMTDNSMEPRFPKKTILVFDRILTPQDHYFALVLLHQSHYIVFRMLLKKNNNIYYKSLNPNHSSCKIKMLGSRDEILGVLIQSKTNFGKENG